MIAEREQRKRPAYESWEYKSGVVTTLLSFTCNCAVHPESLELPEDKPGSCTDGSYLQQPVW